MWPFKKRVSPAMQINLRDSVSAESFLTHYFICGQSGAGKSSAVLRTLVDAACRMGSGILCNVYKSDAADDMERWAKKAKRGSSVVRWNGRNFRFNFVHYFLARFGEAGIGSVLECLLICMEIIRTSSAMFGKHGDQFWLDTTRNHLASALPLLFGATGTVRLTDLLRFFRSLPQSAEQVQSAEWRAQSFFFHILQTAQGKIDDATYERCLEYFQSDFSQLDPRTRTSIHISTVTAISRLTQGLLHDAFCTTTTIAPEVCFLGTILILDTPHAIFGADGIIFQKIVNYCFQEAVALRPTYAAHLRDRIVLHVADEAQEFTMPRDTHFLAICRSHKVGVIYATQSLPTLTSRIGGEHPQERVFDLLSHFATKIWLASGCHTTNTWASNTIGRVMHLRNSYNQGEGLSTNYGMGMGENTSWGVNSSSGGSSSHSNNGSSYGSSWSSGTSSGGGDSINRNRGHGTNLSSGFTQAQQMDNAIEPGFFAYGLRTGGAANGGIVDAVWFKSGHTFHTGANYVFASFTQ